MVNTNGSVNVFIDLRCCVDHRMYLDGLSS
jgi:hypothetical protein